MPIIRSRKYVCMTGVGLGHGMVFYTERDRVDLIPLRGSCHLSPGGRLEPIIEVVVVLRLGKPHPLPG